jgi:GT2 family glycosyltransferase
VKISVIIPTKNRPVDLLATVRAVISQTPPPDELVIVDQTSGNLSEASVRSLLKVAAAVRLIYIWDPKINGLPMARNAGFAACSGEIICYLDDDTSPAPAYLLEVTRAFEAFPEWDGMCGRITETENPSRVRAAASALFRIGLFKDDRPSFARRTGPAGVRLLPGAACSFRRRVLERFSFDETMTGYALGEDVEFCLRAGSEFRFGVYPGAGVVHRRSAASRPDPGDLRTMARLSANRLWRKHRRHTGDDLCYLWLLAGFGAERLVSMAVDYLKSPLPSRKHQPN